MPASTVFFCQAVTLILCAALALGLKLWSSMSIFEFMAQYVGCKYWRSPGGQFEFRERLRQNRSAEQIFLIWKFAAYCLFCALLIFMSRGIFLGGLGFLGVSAALFALSFLHLPEAKRIHEIRKIMENEILFGKHSDES